MPSIIGLPISFTLSNNLYLQCNSVFDIVFSQQEVAKMTEVIIELDSIFLILHFVSHSYCIYLLYLIRKVIYFAGRQ